MLADIPNRIHLSLLPPPPPPPAGTNQTLTSARPSCWRRKPLKASSSKHSTHVLQSPFPQCQSPSQNLIPPRPPTGRNNPPYIHQLALRPSPCPTIATKCTMQWHSQRVSGSQSVLVVCPFDHLSVCPSICLFTCLYARVQRLFLVMPRYRPESPHHITLHSAAVLLSYSDIIATTILFNRISTLHATVTKGRPIHACVCVRMQWSVRVLRSQTFTHAVCVEMVHPSLLCSRVKADCGNTSPPIILQRKPKLADTPCHNGIAFLL